MKNKFKDKLVAGERAVGVWQSFPSPEMTEFMGLAGFDFLVIDAEHYAFGRETVQDIVRAAQLTGMTPLARVPKNDPELILGFLETGVMGIIVPHVNNAEEARRVVQAVKYPPFGLRGAGSTTRAANYGLSYSSAEYFDLANRQTVVIPMVEEEAAIDNLPEILQVEGLDSVFIGQGDLSLSLGFPGQLDHPKVRDLVNRAKTEINLAGLPLGALGVSSEAAQKAFAEGATYFALSIGGYLGLCMKQFLSKISS